jgi:tetratricopeptide (TPR) repeat protein
MARAESGGGKARIVVPLWQALVLGVVCVGVGYWIGSSIHPKVSAAEPQVSMPPPTEDEGMPAQQRDEVRLRIERTTNYDAIVQIGHDMFDAGEVDLGIMAYEKALSIHDSDPNVWTDLGALYTDGRGDHAKAIECFRRALRIDPEHAKAHFNLGVATLREKADVEAAKREFAEYLRLAPNGDEAARAQRFLKSPGESLRQMAQSERGQGRFAEAERMFRAAIRIDPGDPEDWYWLGVVLIHQEKLNEGLDAWAKYEQQAPTGEKMDTVRQMRPNIQRAMQERNGG